MVYITLNTYLRAPFWTATKFVSGLKRKFKETIFINPHWCLLFSLQYVHVTIEFLLIFMKQISWKSP